MEIKNYSRKESTHDQEKLRKYRKSAYKDLIFPLQKADPSGQHSHLVKMLNQAHNNTEIYPSKPTIDQFSSDEKL